MVISYCCMAGFGEKVHETFLKFHYMSIAKFANQLMKQVL